MRVEMAKTCAPIAARNAGAVASLPINPPVSCPTTLTTISRLNNNHRGKSPTKPSRDKTTNAPPVTTLGTTTNAARPTHRWRHGAVVSVILIASRPHAAPKAPNHAEPRLPQTAHWRYDATDSCSEPSAA